MPPDLLAAGTYGVYAATKAGVEAMTHILAKELGKRRITVNVVAPGPVETELFLKGKSEEQIRADEVFIVPEAYRAKD